ncbi:hypothetical protein Taro_033307 [Colocasia esculenta]|uniref:Uncharacterized protein n=1 Tax=Colocasia esculenta TaxID=4460 RepID=A0A843WC48_COLES|nr:hypothetical protein [Colocasia esculenta]
MDQDHGQIPQRGDVEGLEELPLVGSPIAVHSKRDGALLEVFLCKGQATAQGDLGAHNTMAAVEPAILFVEVHRPSFAIGAPGAAAHELREGLNERAPAAEEDAVVPIGRDDGILAGDSGLHADGDGLLAVVEVAESTDELGLVEGVRGDLHPTHHGHFPEEPHELPGGGLDLPRGRLALVADEGDAGLHGDGGGLVGEMAEPGGDAGGQEGPAEELGDGRLARGQAGGGGGHDCRRGEKRKREGRRDRAGGRRMGKGKKVDLPGRRGPPGWWVAGVVLFLPPFPERIHRCSTRVCPLRTRRVGLGTEMGVREHEG